MFLKLVKNGLYVGADAKIEEINCKAKEAVPFSLRSFEVIRDAVLNLNISEGLDEQVRYLYGLPRYEATQEKHENLLPVEIRDIMDIENVLERVFSWKDKHLTVQGREVIGLFREPVYHADEGEEGEKEKEERGRDIAAYVSGQKGSLRAVLKKILGKAIEEDKEMWVEIENEGEGEIEVKKEGEPSKKGGGSEPRVRNLEVRIPMISYPIEKDKREEGKKDKGKEKAEEEEEEELHPAIAREYERAEKEDEGDSDGEAEELKEEEGRGGRRKVPHRKHKSAHLRIGGDELL